jgi:serine/threonine protein kinase
MQTETQTLSQRLSEGRVPVPEALQLAVKLGNALRQIHDGGHAQGALTPDHVLLTGADLQLLPAESVTSEDITPYTAPELLHEGAPDVRTDIFSFGAVVYEMLTGLRAFSGDNPEALAESITNATPAPIGLPGVDRLIATCLAKDPSNRWQRMQQVLTETRLAATVRRADKVATPNPNRQMEALLRAEIEQLEARLAARLEQYERATIEMQRSFAEELATQQQSSMETVSESLGALRAQLSETDCHLDAALERASQAEQAAEGALGEIAGLHVALSDELHSLNDKVKTQSTAMDSARVGMARTDDLVERVVEALEVLQGMVFEQSEERIAQAS